MKVIPYVHKDRIRKRDGKLYYVAEITTNAGTHEVWLHKKKVDDGEIEVR
jgi:hypothetical protein